MRNSKVLFEECLILRQDEAGEEHPFTEEHLFTVSFVDLMFIDWLKVMERLLRRSSVENSKKLSTK